MPSDWEDLHDVAALYMSPSDIVAGKKRLIGLGRTARNKIGLIISGFYVIQILLSIPTIAMTLFIIMCIFTEHPFDHNLLGINPFYGIFFIIGIMIANSYLLDCIQFRPQLLPWLRLPEKCHPQELVPLLDGLRSGAWKARSKRGILPNYMYDSEWNILLFSGTEHKSERRWLRRLGRVAYDGDIEARRIDGKDKLEDVTASPPPRAVSRHLQARRGATAPAAKGPAGSKSGYKTHWLLSIPEAHFEAFLEAAAKAKKWEHIDAPRKLRIVLIAARKSAHQQRESGNDLTIAQMRIASVAALKEAFTNEPGAFIGLTGKQGDRSANSDNWIDLVLRMSGDAAYSEIRRVALRFTPQTSESHEGDA